MLANCAHAVISLAHFIFNCTRARATRIETSNSKEYSKYEYECMTTHCVSNVNERRLHGYTEIHNTISLKKYILFL